jgi:hypothetical protein
MRVNSYVYGILAVGLFLAVIFGAKGMGVWQTSGKVSASGEKITATGANVEEIKGWMTIGDVAKAYNVPLTELAAAFNLPSDTPAGKQIKELESATFSVTGLRTWLSERQKK